MYLIDPLTRHPGGMLIESNLGSDRTKEVPTYTCGHCQRVVIMNPTRTRPRNMCRRCMRQTCETAGCLQECNPIERDLERAYANLLHQPWMLRENGYPVNRLPDGGLIQRRRDGRTDRAL